MPKANEPEKCACASQQSVIELSLTEKRLFEQRKIYLVGAIEEDACIDIIQKIEVLNMINSNPISLYITSPGGNIADGFALVDFIEKSKAPIHTFGIGLNASMGAVILASGAKKHRTITKNGTIMLHRASWGTSTDYDANQEKLSKFLKKECEKIYAHIAGIVSKQGKEVKKDCEHGLWLTAKESIAYGLVDGIY